MDLKFWVPTVALPLIVFIASAVIRSLKDTAHTAVSDFLTVFIVFDGLFLVDPEQVTKAANWTGDTHQAIGAIFVIFTVLIIFWAFSLFELEPKIQDHHQQKSANFPVLPWCFTWAVGASAFVIHVAFLTGRIAA